MCETFRFKPTCEASRAVRVSFAKSCLFANSGTAVSIPSVNRVNRATWCSAQHCNRAPALTACAQHLMEGAPPEAEGAPPEEAAGLAVPHVRSLWLMNLKGGQLITRRMKRWLWDNYRLTPKCTIYSALITMANVPLFCFWTRWTSFKPYFT